MTKALWRMDFEDIVQSSPKTIYAAVFYSPLKSLRPRMGCDEVRARHGYPPAGDCVVISDEVGRYHPAGSQAYPDAVGERKDAPCARLPSMRPCRRSTWRAWSALPHHLQRDAARRVCAVSTRPTTTRWMSFPCMRLSVPTSRRATSGWTRLNQVLADNIRVLLQLRGRAFLRGVGYSRPQGTYMVFLDCTEWCREHGCDIQWLLDEGRAWALGIRMAVRSTGPATFA